MEVLQKKCSYNMCLLLALAFAENTNMTLWTQTCGTVIHSANDLYLLVTLCSTKQAWILCSIMRWSEVECNEHLYFTSCVTICTDIDVS